MKMGIKVIKNKKVVDYTFTDDSLSLGKMPEKNKSESRKDKTEYDYRLRDDAKISRIKHKPKVTGGGHSMHSHSPVYE